jgi:hypothetical protein
MYVNNSKKLIFVHVPKNGGTSITNSLLETGDWKHIFSLEPALIDMSPRDQGVHVDTKRLRYFPRYDDFEIISISRNPWSRQLSIFTYWLSQMSRIMNDDLKEHPDPDLREYFNQDYSPWIKNMHPRLIRDGFKGWVTTKQHEHIMLGPNINWEDEQRTSKHHWFKLETEMDHLADFLDLQKFQKLNHSSHLHYTEYYDDEMIKIISNVYSGDIERFDYEYGK